MGTRIDLNQFVENLSDRKTIFPSQFKLLNKIPPQMKLHNVSLLNLCVVL